MRCLTHRQFLVWEEHRYAEEWERPTALLYYLAREFSAEYLTNKGEKINPEKGVMKFPRVLKLPPTPKQKAAAESLQLKAALIQATGGGKVRHYLRHKDGTYTDAATGEPVEYGR